MNILKMDTLDLNLIKAVRAVIPLLCAYRGIELERNINKLHIETGFSVNALKNELKSYLSQKNDYEKCGDRYIDLIEAIAFNKMSGEKLDKRIAAPAEVKKYFEEELMDNLHKELGCVSFCETAQYGALHFAVVIDRKAYKTLIPGEKLSEEYMEKLVELTINKLN